MANVEIAAVDLGPDDVVVIRSANFDDTAFNDIIKNLRAQHPAWTGFGIALRPEDSLEKIPKAMAQRIYQMLERMFGPKARRGGCWLSREQLAALEFIAATADPATAPRMRSFMDDLRYAQRSTMPQGAGDPSVDDGLSLQHQEAQAGPTSRSP